MGEEPEKIGHRIQLAMQIFCVCLAWASGLPTLYAQTGANSAQNAGASSSGNGAPQNGWVVRDPTTGRLFHQQLVQVDVPAVRWESKQVTATVLQPQWVSRVEPQTQMVLQPQTQTVLQPYWQNRWNPFRQPILAYRHVPQTTWNPTNVTTSRVVTAQQWTPVQQTINVPQPVTETRTVQQLVQTEIPQTGPSLAAAIPSSAIANQPPPLVRVPLLAGRPAWLSPGWQSQTGQSLAGQSLAGQSQVGQIQAWQNTAMQNPSWQSPPTEGAWVASRGSTNANTHNFASTAPLATGPAFVDARRTNPTYPVLPPTAMASNTNGGLRPVMRAVQNFAPPAYNAPMQTASRANSSWDVMQSGLRPTVLR